MNNLNAQYKPDPRISGTLEQIAGDIVATRKLGASELLFDVQFSPGVEGVDDIVARMEQLWQVAK